MDIEFELVAPAYMIYPHAKIEGVLRQVAPDHLVIESLANQEFVVGYLFNSQYTQDALHEIFSQCALGRPYVAARCDMREGKWRICSVTFRAPLLFQLEASKLDDPPTD